MSIEHTPGPWKTGDEQITRIKAADGTLATISQFKIGGRRTAKEIKANARLLAAAPTLLNAINNALEADPSAPAGEVQQLLAIAARIAQEG